MKKVFVLFLALCMLVAFPACSQKPATTSSSGTQTEANPAADFPNKPITFMIPFDPGSTADIYGRAFAKVAEKYFGQSIIIENKSGGSGAVGLLSMLAQPADGYCFGYNGMNAATNIASGQAQGLTRENLLPLALLCADQCTLAVRPDSQFKSMADIINYAKENPGKFKYGGSQTKGTAEIMCNLIEKYTGIDMTYIAYDDGAKSLLGLLSGDIDCVSSTASLMYPYYEAGQKEMVLLAQSFDKRADNLADIPTLQECGMGLENMASYTSWKAVFISPDTPEEILKVYDDVIYKTVHDQEWLDFINSKSQVNNYMNRQEFGSYFLNQIDELTEMFAQMG